MKSPLIYQLFIENPQILLGTKEIHPQLTNHIRVKNNNNMIFDPDQITIDVLRALLYIRQIFKKRGRILIVNNDFFDNCLTVANSARIDQQKRGSITFAHEEWVHGVISNWSEYFPKFYMATNQSIAFSTFKPSLIKPRSNKKKISRRCRLSRDYKNYRYQYDQFNNFDLIIILNLKDHFYLLQEAAKKKIPTVAFFDSYENPSNCTFPIVSNSESLLLISFFIKAVLNLSNLAANPRSAAEFATVDNQYNY
uniref:Ribosomal protein S2 n=1 Tax=Symbiochloris sp. SG-2018 TaxID=2126034 RepID=A0A976U6P2_9CHLO|nr:ribosomal protein S2 [Symbiochloris sp. SG-2018]UVF37889.1 ribosomal protein S2 [Symbiochloris sp. SG-2018]